MLEKSIPTTSHGKPYGLALIIQTAESQTESWLKITGDSFHDDAEIIFQEQHKQKNTTPEE